MKSSPNVYSVLFIPAEEDAPQLAVFHDLRIGLGGRPILPSSARGDNQILAVLEGNPSLVTGNSAETEICTFFYRLTDPTLPAIASLQVRYEHIELPSRLIAKGYKIVWPYREERQLLAVVSGKVQVVNMYGERLTNEIANKHRQNMLQILQSLPERLL